MKLDKVRVEKYLDEIAAETMDLQGVLGSPDNEILQDSQIKY